MIRSRRAATALLTLATSTLGLAVMAQPAHAAAAPVTAPDTASMYAGNFVEVQPLANDTDADGDDLIVCRIAESSYKRAALEFGTTEDFTQSDQALVIATHPKIKPGTYTFTYYACDLQTLVAGTITLTVKETPDITAKALPGKPGKIKVTNPADFKIEYLYGSFQQGEPDGVVKIAKNSSVILTVRRTQIDWVAYSRKGDYLTEGRIKGIKLPPGTTPPAAGRFGQGVQRLWATSV